MISSAASSAALPQCAHASGRSACSSASRCGGTFLRPVGFTGDLAFSSSSGFSGACGRSSNASLASPSTVGDGAGGFTAGVLRCLRWAMASSSATRSFSFAS
jgi:hypothetical protein